MKSIGVFCGSNSGHFALYTQAAEQLADVMSAAGMQLIYGGAKVGLMGSLANRMLHHGGEW